MKSIDVVDSINIRSNSRRVFNTVIDYANINQWMPHYHCILEHRDTAQQGDVVEHQIALFSLLKLCRFSRRIDTIKDGKCIEESYIKGDLIGKGTWLFEDHGDFSKTSFHCQVMANSPMMHIGFALFGAKAHSLSYQYLLKRLKHYCEHNKS